MASLVTWSVQRSQVTTQYGSKLLSVGIRTKLHVFPALPACQLPQALQGTQVACSVIPPTPWLAMQYHSTMNIQRKDGETATSSSSLAFLAQVHCPRHSMRPRSVPPGSFCPYRKGYVGALAWYVSLLCRPVCLYVCPEMAGSPVCLLLPLTISVPSHPAALLCTLQFVLPPHDSSRVCA